MKRVPIPVPDGRRIFRLAYASRAKTKLERTTVVSLAADAAEREQRNSVSGVLFSGNGIFLQRLEGPANNIRSSMDRIAVDPRYKDVSILSAGWKPSRRFPEWPMQLADQVLPPTRLKLMTDFSPYPSEAAMAAFDKAAGCCRLHERMNPSNGLGLTTFVERLVTSDTERLPVPPHAAQMELRVRA